MSQLNVERGYSLLHEPWIPIRTCAGRVERFGLLRVFENAEGLGEIDHPSPLVTLCLYRLLLVCLYRTQVVKTDADWLNLWKSGWDANAINEYFQKYSDRFDLLSDTHPFLQPPAPSGGSEFPVSRLATDLDIWPFFNHEYKNPIDASDAACRLIEACWYAIPGGTGYRQSLCCQSPCTIIVGRNLRETLMLNLVPHSLMRQAPRQITQRNDFPIWEQEYPAREGNSYYRQGIMDAWTFPMRCIKLIPMGDGLRSFSQVEFEAIKFVGDENERILKADPMQAIQRGTDGNFRALRVTDNRALWRDSGALFAHLKDAERQPALAFRMLQRLASEGAIDFSGSNTVSCRVIWLLYKQRNVTRWGDDRFVLPVNIFGGRGETLTDHLNQALSLAEDVYEGLVNSIITYANKYAEKEGQKANRYKPTETVESFKRNNSYWTSLELPFHQFLSGLDDCELALSNWRKTLMRSACDAFDKFLQRQSLSGRHCRALVAAEITFKFGKKGIFRLMPADPTEKEKDDER